MKINQQGSSLFFALPCMALILYFGIFTIKRQVKEYKIFVAQVDNFLCLKRKTKNLKKYLRFMKKTNKAIRSVRVASFIPKTRLIATASLKALKVSQNYKTKIYLLKSLSFTKCRNSLATKASEEIYSLRGVVIRNKDETAKKIKTKIKFLVRSKKDLSNYIQASFLTKGALKLIQFESSPNYLKTNTKVLF